MASGPDHYSESQRLIGQAMTGPTFEPQQIRFALCAVAHALLAQVAVAAESVPPDRAKAWSKVVGR
jgi:hypothetical protein